MMTFRNVRGRRDTKISLATGRSIAKSGGTARTVRADILISGTLVLIEYLGIVTLYSTYKRQGSVLAVKGRKYLPISHVEGIVGQVFGDRNLKPVHEHQLVATLLEEFRSATSTSRINFRPSPVAVTSVHADGHIFVHNVCERRVNLLSKRKDKNDYTVGNAARHDRSSDSCYTAGVEGR